MEPYHIILISQTISLKTELFITPLVGNICGSHRNIAKVKVLCEEQIFNPRKIKKKYKVYYDIQSRRHVFCLHPHCSPRDSVGKKTEG